MDPIESRAPYHRLCRRSELIRDSCKKRLSGEVGQQQETHDNLMASHPSISYDLNIYLSPSYSQPRIDCVFLQFNIHQFKGQNISTFSNHGDTGSFSWCKSRCDSLAVVASDMRGSIRPALTSKWRWQSAASKDWASSEDLLPHFQLLALKCRSWR